MKTRKARYFFFCKYIFQYASTAIYCSVRTGALTFDCLSFHLFLTIVNIDKRVHDVNINRQCIITWQGGLQKQHPKQ